MKFTKRMCVLAGMALLSLHVSGQDLMKMQAIEPPVQRQNVDFRVGETAWPDSMVTFDLNGQRTRKVTYEYNGLTTIEINYDWDIIWKEDRKYIRVFDDRGNRISSESYLWENEAWKGNYKYNYEYNGNNQETFSERYRWVNNRWENDYKDISQYNDNGTLKFRETWWYEDNKWRGSYKDEYIYDDKKNCIFHEEFSWDNSGWISSRIIKTDYSYNANNKPDSLIEYKWIDGKWENYGKFLYKYDDKRRKVLEEGYFWISNSYPPNINGTWAGAEGSVYLDGTRGYTKLRSKVYFDYDSNGNETLCQVYRWDIVNHCWKENEVGFGYEMTYNSNNQRITEIFTKNTWEFFGIDEITKSRSDYKYNLQGNKTVEHYYSWLNNKWSFTSYAIYYPNTQTSDLEIAETQPVDSGNEGNIEIEFPVPEDGALSGKLTVIFPDGITLNIDKTQLAPELADKLDLIITPQGDNSWLIEIIFKDLRSAQETAEYQKIMDIAYTVDSELGKGTYELLIQNLDFELNDGTRIIEELRKVEIQVLRFGTGINKVENSEVTVYSTGQSLIVNSPFAESIEIYSITGVKLYSVTKPTGEIIVSISHLPDGVLIVKGGNGWVKKIVVR